MCKACIAGANNQQLVFLSHTMNWDKEEYYVNYPAP